MPVKKASRELFLDLDAKMGKTMTHENGHAVDGDLHFRDHYYRLANSLAEAVPFDIFDET